MPRIPSRFERAWLEKTGRLQPPTRKPKSPRATVAVDAPATAPVETAPPQTEPAPAPVDAPAPVAKPGKAK